MNRGRGPAPAGRGVRSGYAAAVDRERYGRGGVSRYSEPQRQPQPSRPPQRRDDRPSQPVRPERVERPPRSEEPWSEVPPEIEEMLRAQMAARVGRPAERQPDRGGSRSPAPSEARGTEPSPTGSTELVRPSAAPRGRRPRVSQESTVAPEAGADAGAAVGAAFDPAAASEPVRRGGRRRVGAPAEAGEVASEVSRPGGPERDLLAGSPATAEPAAGRRRRTPTTADQGEASSTEAGSPKPPTASRSRARTTSPAATGDASTAGGSTEGAATGVRRGRPPRAATPSTGEAAGTATPRARRATGGAAAKKAAGAAGETGAVPGEGPGTEPGETPAVAPRRRSTRGASEPV